MSNLLSQDDCSNHGKLLRLDFFSLLSIPQCSIKWRPNFGLNEKNPAIKNILSLSGTKGKEQQVELMVAQINDLAQLQQGNFTPELMQSFIDRSSTLLGAIGNDQHKGKCSVG